jgi:hypothetical protein
MLGSMSSVALLVAIILFYLFARRGSRENRQNQAV